MGMGFPLAAAQDGVDFCTLQGVLDASRVCPYHLTKTALGRRLLTIAQEKRPVTEHGCVYTGL
jgi:hypothetical protein